MIEDKTKEQQPASPVKPKRGQRLRSLWAQLQCMGLLHRHRLRRKTQNHVNDFCRKLARILPCHHRGDAVCTGLFYRVWIRPRWARLRSGGCGCVRHLRHCWQMLRQWRSRGSADVRGPVRPIWLFFRGCGSLLVHAHRCGKKKALAQPAKPAYIIWPAACAATENTAAHGHVCAAGVRTGRYGDRVQPYRPPAYALEVQVNGQTVGYVANEDVFNSASEAVQERINYADTDHAKWTVEPTYTVTVAHKPWMKTRWRTRSEERQRRDQRGHGPVSGWRADRSVQRWCQPAELPEQPAGTL